MALNGSGPNIQTCKALLKYAEKLAVQSSRYHVADSPIIKEYLDNTYNIESKYIAYGAGLHPTC